MGVGEWSSQCVPVHGPGMGTPMGDAREWGTSPVLRGHWERSGLRAAGSGLGKAPWQGPESRVFSGGDSNRAQNGGRRGETAASASPPNAAQEGMTPPGTFALDVIDANVTLGSA